MYYLYILYSSVSDLYYSGISDTPFIRLEVHNSGHRNTFTLKHRPWVMVALFACGEGLGNARKIENFIKRNKSRKLLEWLIDPANIPTGELAQLVRIPPVRDPAGGAKLRKLRGFLFCTMYYLYILYAPSSDIYYVGISNHPFIRLVEHNTKENKANFTAKHRPWEMAALFECGIT